MKNTEIESILADLLRGEYEDPMERIADALTVIAHNTYRPEQ